MSKKSTKNVRSSVAASTVAAAAAVPVVSVIPADVVRTSSPAATAQLNIQIATSDIVDVAIGEYLSKLEPLKQQLQQRQAECYSRLSATKLALQEVADAAFVAEMRKAEVVVKAEAVAASLSQFTGLNFAVSISGQPATNSQKKGDETSLDIDEMTVSGSVTVCRIVGSEVEQDVAQKDVTIAVPAGSPLAEKIAELQRITAEHVVICQDVNHVDVAIRNSGKLASKAKQTITRSYLRGELTDASAIDTAMVGVAKAFLAETLPAEAVRRLLPA